MLLMTKELILMHKKNICNKKKKEKSEKERM